MKTKTTQREKKPAAITNSFDESNERYGEFRRLFIRKTSVGDGTSTAGTIENREGEKEMMQRTTDGEAHR